jgi:Uma2 family endonuclease
MRALKTTRAEEIIAPPGPMTEEEFEAWCTEDVKAEFVDGEVMVHSPVSTEHTDLNGFLIALMRMVAEHDDVGKVYGSELQVRLRSGLRRVPDVVFVAKNRLDIVKPTYVDGAPDLVLEIISPDSAERDWREKYLEYEAAGVSEYWIIDPHTQQLRAYRLEENKRYHPLPEDKKTGHIRSEMLRGFWLQAVWLWQESLPPLLTAAAELGLIPASKAPRKRPPRRTKR